MSGIMQKSYDWQTCLLPQHLKNPNIPKAFIENDDVRFVLCNLITDFEHEEKQAIYYYSVLDATIDEIAKSIELSPAHVASALGLYSERLASKLKFFKKIMPYNEGDLLSISEILFLER